MPILRFYFPTHQIRNMCGACLSLLSLVACASQTISSPTADPTRAAAAGVPLQQPVALRKPHIVVSPHGNRNDPYYWLRDDTRTDTEMLAYLEAENSHANAILADTEALQQNLYDEMVGRLKKDDVTVPVYERGFWYYTRFEAESNYPIHARRKGHMEAPEEIVLNTESMAKNHAFFRLGTYAVSPDTQMVAYTVDTVGRNKYSLRIVDISTGEQLSDTVSLIEPKLAWANDSRSLYYISKDPVTLLGNKVYRHTLGADTNTDVLVYEEKDSSFYLSVGRTKSNRYIKIEARSTVSSETLLIDANRAQTSPQITYPREREHEYTVDHVAGRFVIRTNWKAKNFRIMTANEQTLANRDTWRDAIPHREDTFIHSVDSYNDFLSVSVRRGGLRRLVVYLWSGESQQLSSDETAYTIYPRRKPNAETNSVRYYYTSMTTPGSTFEFNVKTGERKLLKQEPVLGDFNSERYATERIAAPARDGTSVPMSIAYRKDTPLDGTAPIYQYGYGSYGATIDPIFRVPWLSLMDRGFVVAIAHVRGGQVNGRRWYEDGRLLKKKNTFRDFIDVTQHLVEQGYGAKSKVFAAGGSAGGLLMGAVANMAPHLYRGIVAAVPFVDVATTMLDKSIPLTTNEFDEWGNPEIKAFYDYILSYSPYDNIQKQAYPSMLVTTGLWDSQVQYFEPAKWVAKLRVNKTDTNPLLLHINMEAGHGGQSGRYRRYRELARDYAFILRTLSTPDSRASHRALYTSRD